MSNKINPWVSQSAVDWVSSLFCVKHSKHRISRSKIHATPLNLSVLPPVSLFHSISSGLQTPSVTKLRHTYRMTDYKNNSPSVKVSTQYDQLADGYNIPFIAQNHHEVAELINDLEAHSKQNSKRLRVKKNTFKVENSNEKIVVNSWRFNDWDYKKRCLPTYARGLFTTTMQDGHSEIVIRGYDKFFNIDEVNETKWDYIFSRTRGPYELSLKENGCIIFISGLEDGTLLVCSKHSTGSRSSPGLNHAVAGERWLDIQLARVGKTKADLAKDLRARNATAVAELCDDSFEEHILPYEPQIAGLYLHGINLNLPTFHTYPGPLVQKFANEWGFVKTGFIMMNDAHQVKSFLEEVAATGTHDGRDVEGFVIRCDESQAPGVLPYRNWFFKYKFEEPYLMYRQWRECTKQMISGKQPKIQKHEKITKEYLIFAKQRLTADRKLAEDYMKNHGIIELRNAFLDFKHRAGSDAAKISESVEFDTTDAQINVIKNVVLAPIATIGCGKTTIALALCELFGWGHVQNDNITGKGRPARFVKQCVAELENNPVVIADRNNTERRERTQFIRDMKGVVANIIIVALHFVHDANKLEEIRLKTQDRVMARGDNHQTIQAATNASKFMAVMDSFLERFEPANALAFPDSGFDVIVNLDPLAGSRKNLETIIAALHAKFPLLIPNIPSELQMDCAINAALRYKPDVRHSIPSHHGFKSKQNQILQQQKAEYPGKRVEYFAVSVPTENIRVILEKTFNSVSTDQAKLYNQLKYTKRIQTNFHVTLLHRATSNTYPDLWDKYIALQTTAAQAGVPNFKIGNCDVFLERVVYDNRIMAIVVRLGNNTWRSVNKVTHITVGTASDIIKPKESNDLLASWLDHGVGGGVQEIVFDNKEILKGVVHAVMSK